MNTGINYTLTGERERGIVQNYHRKPDTRFQHVGGKRSDVTGLKKVDAESTLLSYTDTDGTESLKSRFSVGFEVEKTALHRGAVKEYELFCGFERDGSCGYEAVTNILPLLPPCTWRTKVYDMMHKATKIIDDRYSPSDKRCGGHVTIAVHDMNGDEIREHVRKYSGLILAMFRNRLSNYYCKQNMNMLSSDESSSDMLNGWHSKYQLALVKGKLLEFRIVSRFQSVKQMMRRYEFFYELVNYAINVKGSYANFCKRIRPLLISMYDGDTAKADEMIELSKHMQKMINTGKINKYTKEYADPNGYNTRQYDASLRRELGLS
jgi:hypothetical protein